MESGACLGYVDRGCGERLALETKAPLRVQRTRGRMAGLLVGMELWRRDPPLQSGGHRLDLRVDGDFARLDRGPGRPLRRPFAGPAGEKRMFYQKGLIL